ncbi:hypothetical protein [Stackebrandtia albiflava]|nr:hypothetical protein [Stackebrandtia albiflava]
MAGRVRPMSATTAETAPRGGEWVYEVGWGGVRVLVSTDGGEPTVLTRRGRDVSAWFPELSGFAEAVAGAVPVTLDGELLVVDGTATDPGPVEARLRMSAATAAREARRRPATFTVYDILCHRGRDTRGFAWEHRRTVLERLDLSGPAWGTAPVADDPDEARRLSDEYGRDGIVAKRRASTYHDRRTRDWVAVRHRHVAQLVVGGWWTAPEGTALLVGERTDDGLVHRGSVRRGVDAVPDLAVALDGLDRTESPFRGRKPSGVGRAHWVDPLLPVEVRHGGIDPGGLLTDPELVRVRIDLL